MSKGDETANKAETLKLTRDCIDKYTKTQYEKGTEFIIADVKATEKIEDKKYKISKTRAEEIKATGYIE